MNNGTKIGLKDTNGVELKIGDCVILKTWWDTIKNIIEEDIVARIVWKDYAIMVERLDSKGTKFMSVFCKNPEGIKKVRL